MAATPLGQLPRYNGQDQELRAWAENLCGRLEAWSRAMAAPSGEPWIVNGTTDARDIDPTVVTTVAQVVNVLGALLHDLSHGAPLSVT